MPAFEIDEPRLSVDRLVAHRIASSDAPLLDGDTSDRVWRNIHPFTVVTNHGDNFDGHKGLLPIVDRGWSGLLQDLQERGLLQDTLVVWMGEVGRTPVINSRAGRHHWLQGWTVVLAGGGVKPCQRW